MRRIAKRPRATMRFIGLIEPEGRESPKGAPEEELTGVHERVMSECPGGMSITTLAPSFAAGTGTPLTRTTGCGPRAGSDTRAGQPSGWQTSSLNSAALRRQRTLTGP